MSVWTVVREVWIPPPRVVRSRRCKMYTGENVMQIFAVKVKR